METGHAALIGGLMVPVVGFFAFVVLVVVLKSFKSIGPTEIGLVNKRLS